MVSPIREEPRLDRLWTAFIGVIETVTGGTLKGQGRPGETLQSRSTRFLQHFGFVSKPTSGAFAGIETESGACSVAEEKGAGAPTVDSGQTAIHDASGNFVLCKTADGLLIKNLTGNLVIENGAGVIYLHLAGAAEVARKGDAVAATTGVGSMDAFIDAVIYAFAALGRTVAKPTTFGTISGGSSNVKAG